MSFVLAERHALKFAQRKVMRNAHVHTPGLIYRTDPHHHAGMSTRLHVHLRAHRKMRGMTQEQVANILGIRNSTLSGWETGSRTLDLEDIENLAKVYRVHPAALLMSPAEGERFETMRLASHVASRLDSETVSEWIRLGQKLADSAEKS